MARKEIFLIFNYLENNRGDLNSIQSEYIASLKKQFLTTDVLTKSQVEWLYEMKGYIPSLVMENRVYKSESDNYPAQYSSFDHLSAFRI
jgi:hypothetical protein